MEPIFDASEWEDSSVLQEASTLSAPMYCRSSSNQVAALSEALIKHHPGSTEAFITSSGMAAISAIIQAVLQPEIVSFDNTINLLISSELYCDTSPLLAHWANVLGRGKVKVVYFPIESPETYTKEFQKLKNQVNILFVESCSNDSQYIFDFSTLSKFKSISKQLIVIVDNTWLSHVIFNPFEIPEVDFVVSSMSKYYSGGTAISGMILVRLLEHRNSIFKTLKFMGAHVAPEIAEQLLKTLQTMETRVRAASETLYDILDSVKSHNLDLLMPNIEMAERYFKKYPKLQEDSSSSSSQLRVCLPPIITFKIDKAKNATQKILKASGLRYATSFGGIDSRLDNWPTRLENGQCQCRLSIGFQTKKSQQKLITTFLIQNAVKIKK